MRRERCASGARYMGMYIDGNTYFTFFLSTLIILLILIRCLSVKPLSEKSLVLI